MASIIKIKRSTTPGAIPSSGDLQAGELAVNLADQKIFSSSNGTDILTLGGDTADTLSTSRAIALSGDVVGTVNFDGSADVTISTTIQSNSVALGTDTTGDYVESLVAGSNLTVTNNSGEGATPTIALNSSITADVTGDVTGNLTGNVTGAVTGNVTGDLTGNVTGNVTGDVTGNTAGVHTGAVTGDVTGNVTGDVTGNTAGVHTGAVTGDVTGNLTGNVTGNVTGDVTGAVTGNVTGDLTGDVTGNADTASALATARSIALSGDVTGTVNFDGSAGVTIATTIAADSVALGTDTTGNYAASVSGTANEIEVTGTAGEGTTFQIGLPDDVTIGNDLVVTGETSVGGNLTVDGNLNVEGAVTYISSSTVNVDDSMLKLSANNAGDTVDTGVYGLYVDGATNKYSGYYRDATDGSFKFYAGLQSEPTTTVDATATGYALAQVDAVIDGGTY